MSKTNIMSIGVAVLAGLLFGCANLPTEQKPQPLNRDARFDSAVLRATTDHADALYRCGEKMVFTLNAEGVKSPAEGAYYLDWKQWRDDGTERSGIEAFDPASPKVFETSIDRPGFVRYSFTLLGADKRPIYKSKDGTWGPIAIICECGAGAEPEKLDFPPEPTDFDAFWGKQLAELRKVPRNAKVEQIPFKDAGFDCYRLSIPCAGGRPVTGYMTVPKGPKDAKWPLTISFHGYGTFKQTAPKDGPKDKIDISINAHGYELGRESDYYKEFWKGVKLNERGQYGMDLADNARPETSYFRGMVLRAVRAVEWAKTLKNWDGRNLRVWGGSQGGMQSLWVAALVDGITELEPIVPWGADIIGKTKGRYSFPALRLEYAPGLDYYDTVNFAKRIPATCRVNISRSGLGDIHCPPSGQWLLYRAIKAPKSITFLQNSNHGGAPGGKEKNQHTTYSEGVAADAPKNAESSATAVLGDAWNK